MRLNCWTAREVPSSATHLLTYIQLRVGLREGKEKTGRKERKRQAGKTGKEAEGGGNYLDWGERETEVSVFYLK